MTASSGRRPPGPEFIEAVEVVLRAREHRTAQYHYVVRRGRTVTVEPTPWVNMGKLAKELTDTQTVVLLNVER